MSRLVRREFLRAVVVLAGPRLLAGCSEDKSPAPASVDYFPQSVASGDPRPTSVVLWTRVVDPTNAAADQTLELVVATDEALKNVVELQGGGAYPIVAQAVAGGCVKVRVEGLLPGTTYYYRFTFVRGSERHASRTGRTRTAPDPGADTAVSFAVVSCQDYGGRYYHAYRHLAEHELDFVLHLGDYIYETIDDPSFQSSTHERSVKFSAPDEALVVDAGGDLGAGSGAAVPVLAARSLGNYRDLYRTYRSDPDMQRVHERFPIVAIPDDHEFSNDCYGATGTYTNDRENEEDFARRRAADQAWFEYTPVDYSEPPASALDPSASFPDDFRLYRNFVFGQRLELVVTDLRRYRPDHVVPENAFPGAVFLTDTEAKALLGAVPDDLVAIVDIDGDDVEDVRTALLAVVESQGFDPAGITGLLSVPWINQTLVAAGEEAPLDETDSAYARGYAYHQLFKSQEFSEQGSRYLVAERPFRALAQKRFGETNGESERLLGDEQRAWFTSTLAASTRTWKVWANEYTLMRRAIDLTPVELAPDAFRQRILLTAEDWDGAPNERNALLTDLAGVENLVVVTGDLHAFFAGTPYAEDAPDTRVIEFVAGSITSATWLASIEQAVADNPSLPPYVGFIAGLVGSLLTDTDTRANPHIGWLDLASNGYAVVTASAGTLEATTYALDAALVPLAPNALPKPLDELVTATQFRVQAGSRELEQLFDATWKRWDRDSMSWV
jgi:alkaline phosphatase D